MKTPKVSVVMSVYNGAPYLRQAIESILAQTFDDFEFLIINDASTDETRQILTSFRDPRIIALENEQNLGLAASLNLAIDGARGEYIARQDADDLSYPQRLAEQVAFLDAHRKVGAVGATTEWIDSAGNTLQIWRQPTENADIQQTLLRYCCLIHGSTMYRHVAALQMGNYDSKMRTGQDYDFWLRLSEMWDMACLPETLYRYRWHENMASRERRVEQENNAEIARARALQRRLTYGWRRLGLSRALTPGWVQTMDRRRLAQRYVWWSAGAREHSRSLALRFLIIAFLLDPTTPEIWRYVAGIVGRKVHRLSGRVGFADKREHIAS